MSAENDYELTLEPAEVEFLETLWEGEFSKVFKVLVHGKKCVLKVYHAMPPDNADPPWRVVDIFICESTAYKRLKQKGLCERKLVPDFYGTIKNIQPNRWLNLHTFLDDDLLPNATLIEYIPYLQELDLSNFANSRTAKLRQILNEIHKIRIYHGDPYPRNMMVSLEPGKEERVLWIDFDRAQTCPEDKPLTERQGMWFRQENEFVDNFFKNLSLDYEEGKLSRVWRYYYE